MGRKCKPKVFKACVVCGDKASGINFGSLSCQSCKAFFRRNALQNKELKCPFKNACGIDQISRRFCPRCRLKRCFEVGMKKEWILTEEEKQLYKNRVLINRIRRETEELEGGDSASALPLSQQQSTPSAAPTFAADFTSPSSCFTSPSTYSNSSNSSFSNLIVSNSSAYTEPTKTDLTEISPCCSNWNSADNSPNSSSSQLGTQIEKPVSLEATNFTNNFDDLYAQLFQNASETNGLTRLNPIPESDMLDILSLSESLTDPGFSAFLEENFPRNSTSSQQELTVRDPTQLSLDLNASPVESRNLSSNSFNVPLYREPGLPAENLLSEEKLWLQELSIAGSMLHNPYRQIRDYQRDYSPICGDITLYFFYRQIRMARKLKSFKALMPTDQARMLKFSLLELLAIRSVLMYHQDRDAWCFVDDKNKVGVMARMELLRPFCTCDYRRHQALPRLFRDEWKRDNVIFDLLTAIILFTPRVGLLDPATVSHEQHRYQRLLYRYLTTAKYGGLVGLAESEEAFNRLMGNLEELRTINVDVFNFFRGYANLLQKNPLFTELLDRQKSSVCIEAFNELKI